LNYSNFSIGYTYALNDSRWSLNYSNYSITHTYALNDSRWSLNYSNYTTGWFNWPLNYSNFSIGYTYALNDSRWSLNYSNYSITHAYALNASLWSLNYSNYSLGWNYATNSTATLGAANIFGAFNQTFDTNALFINANDNRIGINVVAPNSTLHVIGTFNFSNASFYPVMYSTADGNITFDGTGLRYDAISNRVGIGTTSPSTALHVAGAINLTGTSGNISIDSGNRICYNQPCTSYGYNNGSALILI
jgi:hypothetical protein